MSKVIEFMGSMKIEEIKANKEKNQKKKIR
jgi:hypothetical protein